MKNKLQYLQIIYLFAIIIIFSGHAFGQQFSFRNYTVKDGIPQSEVHSMVQDDNGYMWCGTMNGISQFDGKEFKNFSKKDGLGGIETYLAIKDKKGNLWFGHGNGTLTKLDVLDNSFSKVYLLGNKKEATGLYINCIVQDKSERIWVGTQGKGVFYIENKKVYNISSKQGLPDDDVLDLDEDDEGNIWIITYTGKIIYNLEKNIFKSFNLPAKYNKMPFGCIIYDHNGNIWIGSSGNGVIKFNPKIGKIFHYTIQDGLADNFIYSFDLDNSNRVWVNHSESGVSKYIPSPSENIKGHFETYSNKNGFPSSGVLCTLQDNESNYWFGTLNGIVQLIGGQFELWTENQGLVNNVVWSILIDNNNDKWFGSMGGLTKLDNSTNNISTFTKFHEKYLGDVWDLSQSDDGKIWFGCSQGILSIDSKNYKIEQIKLPKYFQKMYLSAYVYSSDDNIWIASYYDGLINYNPRNKSFVYLSSKNGKIPSDSVSYIMEDSNGIIWAGFSNKGLAKFDGKKFNILESPIKSIDYMIEGTKDDYWIISSQSQLFRFINGEFINYSDKFGLTENIIYSLIADSNSLWLGTTRGIARHFYNDSTFKFFGIKQGYPISEANARATFRDHEGNLWFGTTGGALRFNPEKDKPNLIPPQTHITGLKLFQDDIQFPDNASFNYDENYLAFKYIGISFTNSEVVKYQYRLLGFDTNWSQPSKNNIAKFSKLSPGEYTFQVKACNNDGIWNDKPTEYNFSIDSPYWTQWWFVLFAIFVGILLIYLFIKWRTKYLAKIRSQLEKEIDDRTNELQKEKKQLAVTLKSIGEGVIATEIKGKISLINDHAKKILDVDKDLNQNKYFNDILRIYDIDTEEEILNPFEYLLSNDKEKYSNKEYLLKTLKENQKLVSIGSALLLDESGISFGNVFVFRDTTEQKAIENELQKNQKLESLGILAGGIAHDFNNILTAVIGNLSLAKYSLSSKDEVYELLENAENASVQAKGLTHQLLTFAKGGTPIKGIVSITDIINESLGFILSGSNVKYHTYFEENLPLVELDSGQVSQVIQNLIINADQSMPNGGNLYINVERKIINKNKYNELNPGIYIQIDIKDGGIGIPKNHLNKIFDPFFSTKSRGSGLGLSTSYSIIRKHDGLLSVKSEIGKGSTFTILLPASEKYKQGKAKKIIKTKNLKGFGKILIMDDEQAIHNLSSNILEKHGYEVFAAYDGKEVLKLYKEATKENEPFAATVLDLTIPGGMGGKETIRELLKFDPDAIVIVSSGYSTDEVMSNFEKYGFKGCLKKPYNSTELLELLKDILP